MNKRKEKFEDILRYRFTAWVKEILKNAKLKYLYTELRRIHTTISLEECDEKNLCYEMEEPEVNNFFFCDERINNAYMQLNETRKKVLILYYIKEMSINEISEVLKISAERVSDFKYQALKKLNEVIDKELKNGK